MRRRYIMAIVDWEEHKTVISCRQFNIQIEERTLGQAMKRFGNALKRLKVQEIKQGLE